MISTLNITTDKTEVSINNKTFLDPVRYNNSTNIQ
jgi:hypothetical protein